MINYKTYSFIIFFFISFNFFAQNPDSTQAKPIDMTAWNLEVAKKNYPEKVLSILTKWEDEQNQQKKAEYLAKILEEMRGTDIKGFFYFTNKLSEIGNELKSDTIIFNAKRLTGVIHSDIGDYESAHIYFLDALEFADSVSFKYGIAEANSLMAANYHLLTQNEKGIAVGEKRVSRTSV